jgi:methylmalonyl-CoA mutase, N-terminal domain
VNGHEESVTHELDILRISPDVERDQVSALTARREARDGVAVAAALAGLAEAARSEVAMIEPMLDAARAEATLGEICDTLRAEWGGYQEPATF